jgi:HEPN domain-containing protein
MTARSLEIAESDRAMAGASLGLKLYGQCIFHCQQALEKVLKAIWFESRETNPPKIHGLVALSLELGIDLDEIQRKFLQVLSEQYSPRHYAEFQAEYPVEAGDYYLEKTGELFEWLRQRLSLIDQSRTLSSD